MKDPRLKIPIEDQPYWVNKMLQIVFVESGGDPYAHSGMAKGLTQLKDETGAEIAKELGIVKYDIYNGWDNLFLGIYHQMKMEKLYGKDLAAWAHHQGMGNISQMIITYLTSVKKLPLMEIDRIFSDPTNELLPKYIEKYHITPTRLLMSPAVTAKLKQIGAFDDDTQYYNIRLEAANRILNSNPQTKV